MEDVLFVAMDWDGDKLYLGVTQHKSGQDINLTLTLEKYNTTDFMAELTKALGE